MKVIQSRDNTFFKALHKLAGNSRQRNKTQQTLLDGAHLLAAYLDAGLKPQHIVLSQAALHDAEISQLLQCVNDVPMTQLDDKLFAELTELKTPTGLLSVINIPVTKAVKQRFVLLLEDIQDPGNIGSIIRSAAAAGCDAIYLSNACADVWSPKVLRAAMGGHFVLNLFEQQDLCAIAQHFSGHVLATSLQAKKSLYQFDLTADVALMMGNEGAGLSAKLQAAANALVYIPMPGKVESLNVAAATAVCLFEVLRQRQVMGLPRHIV